MTGQLPYYITIHDLSLTCSDAGAQPLVPRPREHPAPNTNQGFRSKDYGTLSNSSFSRDVSSLENYTRVEF